MRISFLRQFGFTLEAIAAHMELSKGRVHVLASKGSQRIEKAVKEMRKAGRK